MRIPSSVARDKGKGYIEDRRPASDIDPYVVAALLCDTTLLEKSLISPMLTHYKEWEEWRDITHIEM